ncbi:hypothetical protein BH20ACT9_BH20ACT9_10860 [soil metagenome]
MVMDDETLARVRAALDESPRVDARRVDVAAGPEEVLLRGTVATPEEATVAGLVAEQHAVNVRNQLAVDANLREGTAEPTAAEATLPATDEVLVGELDMTAGDQPHVTDMAEALDRNEPVDPPDEPMLAPTTAEERGTLDRDTRDAPIAEEGPVPDPDEVAPSAPDLSAEELRRQGSHDIERKSQP